MSPEYARRAGPRVNPLLGVGVGEGCTGEPVLVAPGRGEYRGVEWKGLGMAFASPEDKFGIKVQSRRAPRTLEQSFSMIAGSIYVVGGIIGFFITGFSNFTEMTNHALFGIFMLNPYHNIVHISIGSLWLLAALALTPAGTEGMHRDRWCLRAGCRPGLHGLPVFAVHSHFRWRQLAARGERSGAINLW
ncbi:MAG TPA: DUF4383 domain-containing protein [Pseudonocardiaceae bacterium]|nr:DUF4383 domain-containing protein [Pseudonocardiaceae bacterium]